ncbi:MAG TPA: response regulator [Verrucomicrobiae bacterium]|nr:response regulator [Verrucomicrobiae bacterium]
MNVKTSKKKTIVFIEDDPVVLMAYRNHLEAGGFHIKPVVDGLEAMKLLSRFVPDLVILDLMLPRFNGVDVLKYIRSNSNLKAVPVITLSTNSIVDTTEEYVLERAHKRMLKDSCTPAIMLQTVQELLADQAVSSGVSIANPSDGSPAAKNRTIVFVDDNPVVLAAYRDRLEQGGFQVEPARDGLEAMKLLGQLVPDVVVLDLLLPRFNGVDVLKFICSTPRLSAVCVIIFSTSSIIAAAEESVLERASKRLLKDACTPAIMFQTVRELLAGASGQTGAVSAGPSDGSQTNESKADGVLTGIRSAP